MVVVEGAVRHDQGPSPHGVDRAAVIVEAVDEGAVRDGEVRAQIGAEGAVGPAAVEGQIAHGAGHRSAAGQRLVDVADPQGPRIALEGQIDGGGHALDVGSRRQVDRIARRCVHDGIGHRREVTGDRQGRPTGAGKNPPHPPQCTPYRHGRTTPRGDRRPRRSLAGRCGASPRPHRRPRSKPEIRCSAAEPDGTDRDSAPPLGGGAGRRPHRLRPGVGYHADRVSPGTLQEIWPECFWDGRPGPCTAGGQDEALSAL